ncbi:carbohydrate binding domain-containing protein [Agarivorans sp. Toyoura001]|uniref:carbohydrate binding domain-containing protein n=1 Tax=unclassified Agarivorans TaxID=2636026 RepID=UPI001F34D275|nr:carbohydrate binding domain-containing protein [Agarivorans sp. Toyoura001]
MKPLMIALSLVLAAVPGYAASLDIALDGGKRWEPINAGTDGWGDGSGQFSFSGDKVTITVKEKASNPWHIQLKRARVALSKGKRYQITAELSASQESPLTIMLQKDSGDYMTYFAEDLVVNREPQQVDLTFVATNSDKKAAFAFFVGGAESEVTYTLNNIRLVSEH